MHIEFSFSIIQKINASFLHLGRCTSTHLDVRGLVRFYTLRNGLEAVVPIYQTVSHLKSNFPWRHHEITDIFSPSSLPCQSPQDKYHNSKPFQATISWHADDIWPDLFFSPKPNSRSHARARFFFKSVHTPTLQCKLCPEFLLSLSPSSPSSSDGLSSAVIHGAARLFIQGKCSLLCHPTFLCFPQVHLIDKYCS